MNSGTMSNQDPVPYEQTHQYLPVPQANRKANDDHFPDGPLSSSSNFNPDAGHFQPSAKVPDGSHQNGRPSQANNNAMEHSYNSQVSSSSLTSTIEKMQVLERSHNDLRTNVDDLKALCNEVYAAVEVLKKGRWSVEVGPFQDKAEDFRQKMDQLKLETLKASSGANTDSQRNNSSYGDVNQYTQELNLTRGTASLPPHTRKDPMFIPPHKRGQQQTEQNTGLHQFKAEAILKAEQHSESAPPQRKIAVAKGALGSPIKFNNTGFFPKDASDRLCTDGMVDPPSNIIRPAPVLIPPPSPPIDTFQPDVPMLSIEDLYHTTSSTGWQPLYIRQIPPLDPTDVAMIPPVSEMATFSSDFLRNTFGGTVWSPGLNYIISLDGPAGGAPCILPNRTYYTLDHKFEPYLPKQPGDHGAKLTPFFNQNPEEVYPLQDQDGTSFTNVPMFVMTPASAGRNRYVYFGNYSQTRWSDKLDYDRMVEHVPHIVKEYWADELSAVGRPEWLTEQLKKHFFPKPEYNGSLFGEGAEGSVTTVEEANIEKVAEEDVKFYVQELKTWEKDSTAKVKFIRKEFILQAFEEADILDPPGLRLWWEYLQCVGWDRPLYDMLVQLQSRNQSYL